MKVFLSWSGVTSKTIAETLRDWLPFVIPGITPWMSATDIEPGARWSSEISRQLADTSIGILCLTPDNLRALWLQFEAGALSKTLGEARVIPYLFNLDPPNLEGPLMQFQAVKADKDGTKRLVQTLNRARDDREPLFTEAQLDKAFERWWPDLEAALKNIAAQPSASYPSRERRKQPRPLPTRQRDNMSREITNEVAYTFSSRVFGLAYENLVIHGTLHEDGSMSIRRESKLVAHSSKVGVIDQYLLSDARAGAIDAAPVELIRPTSHKLSNWVQKATANSLTLLIEIDPPLTFGESIEFAIEEKTPPLAIARTYEEMLERQKPQLYECMFWDITRPTKHLELKVWIPKTLAPQKPEPGVWFGESRVTSEQELERIGGSFRRELAGEFEELSLEVAYPVPGLRYAIKWIPK